MFRPFKTKLNMEIEKRLARIEQILVLNTKNVLNVSELSLILGVSENRVRVLCCKKEIPHYKRGRSVFFKRSEIEEWQLRDRIPTNDEIEMLAATHVATHRRKNVQA